MIPLYVAQLGMVLAVFVMLLLSAAVMVYSERKVAAFIQQRYGPYLVGPKGMLQPIADVVKLIFKESLRPVAADKVIFLPAGVAGDDTSGHIDDVGRFVAPGKVVLAREDDPNDENYAPLQAAHEFLVGERDARGRRLEVIPLPMPSPRFFDGQRLPASYANFLIVNGRVLVPTFNDPKDRVALGLLAELFPDREDVGVHCLDLVLGLGSIHCSTHHEPLAE